MGGEEATGVLPRIFAIKGKRNGAVEWGWGVSNEWCEQPRGCGSLLEGGVCNKEAVEGQLIYFLYLLSSCLYVVLVGPPREMWVWHALMLNECFREEGHLGEVLKIG